MAKERYDDDKYYRFMEYEHGIDRDLPGFDFYDYCRDLEHYSYKMYLEHYEFVMTRKCCEKERAAKLTDKEFLETKKKALSLRKDLKEAEHLNDVIEEKFLKSDQVKLFDILLPNRHCPHY
jgi:hypothetical protein